MVHQVRQYLASFTVIADEDKLTEMSDHCEPSSVSFVASVTVSPGNDLQFLFESHEI